MKAIKKLVEVERDKSVTLRSLPFKPGSKVEIIVLPSVQEEDIFTFIDTVVKKRKITPMSLKEIEKIVHEARGIR
jgi:predicted DNA-binding antitoxin AbrB/MazE fold protein